MQRRDFLKLFGITAAALITPLPMAPAAEPPTDPLVELDFMIRKSTVVGIGHELLPGLEYLLRLQFEEPARIRYLSTPPAYNEILVEQIGDPSFLVGGGVDLGCFYSGPNGCGVPVDYGIQNPMPIRMRTISPKPVLMTMVMLLDFYEDKSMRPSGYPWNLWPSIHVPTFHPLDLKKDKPS